MHLLNILKLVEALDADGIQFPTAKRLQPDQGASPRTGIPRWLDERCVGVRLDRRTGAQFQMVRQADWRDLGLVAKPMPGLSTEICCPCLEVGRENRTPHRIRKVVGNEVSLRVADHFPGFSLCIIEARPFGAAFEDVFEPAQQGRISPERSPENGHARPEKELRRKRPADKDVVIEVHEVFVQARDPMDHRLDGSRTENGKEIPMLAKKILVIDDLHLASPFVTIADQVMEACRILVVGNDEDVVDERTEL